MLLFDFKIYTKISLYYQIILYNNYYLIVYIYIYFIEKLFYFNIKILNEYYQF